MPANYLGLKGDDLIVFDTEYVNSFDGIIEPSGEYNMTVSDFIKYIQIHLAGLAGNDPFLDKADFSFLHFGLKDYSICWENGKKSGYLISRHSGSKGNFFCHAVLFPELDLGITIMANSGILNEFKILEAAAGYARLDAALKTVLDLYLADSL